MKPRRIEQESDKAKMPEKQQQTLNRYGSASKLSNRQQIPVWLAKYAHEVPVQLRDFLRLFPSWPESVWVHIYGAWKRMSLMRHFWRESPCVVASETIYGVHENQSVKRSGQAGGAARVTINNLEISGLSSMLSLSVKWEAERLDSPIKSCTIFRAYLIASKKSINFAILWMLKQ